MFSGQNLLFCGQNYVTSVTDRFCPRSGGKLFSGGLLKAQGVIIDPLEYFKKPIIKSNIFLGWVEYCLLVLPIGPCYCGVEEQQLLFSCGRTPAVIPIRMISQPSRQIKKTT